MHAFTELSGVFEVISLASEPYNQVNNFENLMYCSKNIQRSLETLSSDLWTKYKRYLATRLLTTSTNQNEGGI